MIAQPNGGAEAVLEVLVELFPAAPVYTSIYSPEAMPPAYRSWEIHNHWLEPAAGHSPPPPAPTSRSTRWPLAADAGAA